MHDRIAINHLCFLSDTMPKFSEHLHALGAKRVSLPAGFLLAKGGEEAAQALVSSGGYGVETIVHPFQSGRQISTREEDWVAPRADLSRVINIAADLGAKSSSGWSDGCWRPDMRALSTWSPPL